VNYRTLDGVDGSALTPRANQKAYDWYMWSGYFEKFASKAYTLEVAVTVDGVAQSAVAAELVQGQDKNTLSVNNLSVPEACKESQNYDYTVSNNGWKGAVKQIAVAFKCADKTEELAKSEKHESHRIDVIEPAEQNQDLIENKSQKSIQEGGKQIQEIILNESQRLKEQGIQITNDIKAETKVDEQYFDNELKTPPKHEQVIDPVQKSKVEVNEPVKQSQVEQIEQAQESQVEDNQEVIVEKKSGLEGSKVSSSKKIVL